METFWKASFVVVLAPAILWSQAETKPKSDGPEATHSASASSNQSGDKTGSPAASQSPPAPVPAATPTPSPNPAPADSTKLEVLKSIRADYPYEARKKQIQGQVLLKLSVSEKGEVQKVDVVRGDPVLADAAISAAKRWKFKPYIRNGKAIPIVTRIPFDFAFGGRIEDAKTSAQDTKDVNTASGANDPLKVLVPAGVTEGNLLHKVTPVYPQEAKERRIEGTVLLHAVIDKEGRVADLQPISGPKELIPASIGAVEQWRYRPYLVMGNPVEVETTITVNFHLTGF